MEILMNKYLCFSTDTFTCQIIDRVIEIVFHGFHQGVKNARMELWPGTFQIWK